jgi:hypothetical protein
MDSNSESQKSSRYGDDDSENSKSTRKNKDSKLAASSSILQSLKFSNPGTKASGLAQGVCSALGKRVVKKQTKFDSRNGDSKSIYDDKGMLKTNDLVGLDICDCLRKDCPGCFFACKTCKSIKCGNTCRCNRNTFFEKVDIEGSSKSRVMPFGLVDND